MSLRALGLAAALVPSLSAQGPAFVPSLKPLLQLRASRVPRLLEQWSESSLGRLFEDEDARRAAQLAVHYEQSRTRRLVATEEAVLHVQHRDAVPPHVLSQVYRMSDREVWRLLEMPIEEVAAAEFTWLLHPDVDRNLSPIFVREMSCLPRHEGRWTQRFEAEAARRAESVMFEDLENASVSGFPAHILNRPEKAAIHDAESLPRQQWMLHLPGRFVYGNGVADEIGAVDAAPQRDRAEVRLQVHVDDAVRLAGAQAGASPALSMRLLGIDKMRRLDWSAYFDGDLLFDVLRVEHGGELGGVLSFFSDDGLEPPAQRLPTGALAQLRARLDLRGALDDFGGAAGGGAAFAAIGALLTEALDGGVAIGCCAPAPGGLIPRLFVTADLADRASFDKLLAMLPPELPVRQVRYGDVDVSILQIDGAPPGIQPAWCVQGDQLHVAESALSMRAFLRAQTGDAVAMDVGGMPPPAGEGELLKSFDLRFDAAAIYENLYERWLPLFELSGGAELAAPLTRDDLPEPEVVAAHLGKGRGALRRSDDAVSLVQASASGGFEMTAMLFAWPTMLSQQSESFLDDERHLAVATDRLAPVHDALAAFERREQRRPKDLAELFVAEALADDALLLPGDDLAEPVELPGGRVVRTSFRYFPEGVEVREGAGSRVVRLVGGGAQDRFTALLVEIRPHQFHRAMLLVDGKVPDTYGSYGTFQPIEAFGKD